MVIKQLVKVCIANFPILNYFIRFIRCKKMENGKIKCTWNVDGNEFEGTGQNGSMAKASAALKALSQLKISN